MGILEAEGAQEPGAAEVERPQMGSSVFTAMGRTNGKYVINHINHLIIDIFCLHCASGCRAAVVGLLLDCCRLLLRLWLKLPTVEAASSRFLVICVIV